LEHHTVKLKPKVTANDLRQSILWEHFLDNTFANPIASKVVTFETKRIILWRWQTNTQIALYPSYVLRTSTMTTTPMLFHAESEGDSNVDGARFEHRFGLMAWHLVHGLIYN